MANTTARLYIRCATGYSTPPKKLVDLPTGQCFYLVWHEGDRKRARSVGRFADKAQVALINQQSKLRKAAINPQAHRSRIDSEIHSCFYPPHSSLRTSALMVASDVSDVFVGEIRYRPMHAGTMNVSA